ncbi:MAG: glycerate kinase [Halanaeroarchaeum sp.]
MTTIPDREALATSPSRDLALACIEAGIEAAHPDRVVREAVALSDRRVRVADSTYDLYAFDRVVVLGGGNAAAQVTTAIESVLGNHVDGGVVVTDDPVPLDVVRALPADHPVPTERGVESTRTLLDVAKGTDEGTLVLGVVTGGGSALMAAPADGISLSALRETTEALLRSGATIHEINAVRKHLSAIKGGRLARELAPATVVSLVFSDVVGNDLDVIASGPLVPDESTYEEALEVIDRYDVRVPSAVRTHLDAGRRGERPETPSRGDPIFDRVSTHVLADGSTALDAAARTAASAGYEPLVLSSRFEGDPVALGRTHAAIVDEVAATGNPVDPPAVLLSGGETTVSVTGTGTGGPNQEFALASALASSAPATVASVDTDGIDGAADAAGAMLDSETLAEAGTMANPGAVSGANTRAHSEATAGGDVESRDDRAREALAEHNVSPFLTSIDAAITTGPTGTNVNDLRVVVVPE